MNDLPGYRVTAVLGFVEGITMRASTVADSFLGSLQATAGADDNTFVQLCQETRQKAFPVLLDADTAQQVLSYCRKHLPPSTDWYVAIRLDQVS